MVDAQGLRCNFVQRIHKPAARRKTVRRFILKPVGDPDIHHRRRSEFSTKTLADFSARHAMINPEATNGGVGMTQREVLIAVAVREAGGIEIQTQITRLRPLCPFLEVLWPDGISLHRCIRLEIDGMEIYALPAGNLHKRSLKIAAQFVGVAGASRIVAAGLDSARQFSRRVLEAAHIVALPALNRDGNLIQGLKQIVCVNSNCGVTFPGQLVGCLDPPPCIFHRTTS